MDLKYRFDFRNAWKRRKSKKAGRSRHDDIVVRSRKGVAKAIPQAKRYRSADWLHILTQTPSSVVLNRIQEPVLVNTLWAFVVVVMDTAFGILPSGARAIGRAHALVGSALGLLLVFRTNAAYNRYWEGCKIWERLLSRSRDMARLALLYRHEIDPQGGKKKLNRIAKLLTAFPYVLSEHITSRQCEEQVNDLLTRDDISELKRMGNKPLCILGKLGWELKSIPDQQSDDQILFSSRERLTFLKYVDEMGASVSQCERLVQTPVPLNYVRHTSRLLTIWCLTLPIALVSEMGLVTVPVLSGISWALFGIQEIGLMIEDPFRRSLKLDVITNTIAEDAREVLSVSESWDHDGNYQVEKDEPIHEASVAPAP